MPFYKPISEADFLAMYMPMVPMIRKGVDLFRPSSRMARWQASCLAIPNYAEGPKTKTAILKTYASLERGAGRHLASMFHKSALDLGFDDAIHALIHDDNQSADRSTAEGATVFRRYSLLGLRLDG